MAGAPETEVMQAAETPEGVAESQMSEKMARAEIRVRTSWFVVR